MNIDVMSASYIQAERIIRVETSSGSGCASAGAAVDAREGFRAV